MTSLVLCFGAVIKWNKSDLNTTVDLITKMPTKWLSCGMGGTKQWFLSRMEQAKIWGCIMPLRTTARNLKLMVYFWELPMNAFKLWSFPGGSVGKESICLQCRRYRRRRFNPACEEDSFSRWGRLPGGGQGNPLQYSCLENPMNRGAWWATVHGVTKSRHNWACMHV